MAFKSKDDVSLKKIETREEKDFIEYWINHHEEGFRLHEPFYLDLSLNSAKKFLKTLLGLENNNRQTFIILVEGQKAGFCGLQDIDYTNGKAHCFCFIKPDHRGNGYGTKALEMVIEHGFKQLRMNKIYADDFVENKPAIKMNKRLGFTEEGVLREHRFQDNEYKDYLRLSLLRDEWEERKNNS